MTKTTLPVQKIISAVKPPIESQPSEAHILYTITWLNWRQLTESERLGFQGIEDMDKARIAVNGDFTYVLADDYLERYNHANDRFDRQGLYRLEFLEE